MRLKRALKACRQFIKLMVEPVTVDVNSDDMGVCCTKAIAVFKDLIASARTACLLTKATLPSF
ncbi:hypothetical protein D3C73_1036870 [compost metagenome]